MRMISMVLSPMIWLYLFCHIGSFLTECFSDLADEFYNIAWYKLPPQIQKNWIIMITFGQKDICLQGFGSGACTRELFMKVTETKNRMFSTSDDEVIVLFVDNECSIFIFYGATRVRFLIKN